jgi:hypothetical protein
LVAVSLTQQANPNLPRVEKWFEAQINYLLSTYSSLNAEDGASLANLADRTGIKTLRQRIFPYVKERASSTPFTIAFLVRLMQLRETKRIPASTIGTLYCEIVDAVVARFDLAVSEPTIPRYTYNFSRVQPTETPSDRQSPTATSPQLIDILKQCAALSLPSAVGNLLQQIQRSAFTAAFKEFLIPYLSALLVHLQKSNTLALMDNDCCQHVRLILQAYIIRYVGKEPQWPSNWARPLTSVSCNQRSQSTVPSRPRGSGRDRTKVQRFGTGLY